MYFGSGQISLSKSLSTLVMDLSLAEPHRHLSIQHLLSLPHHPSYLQQAGEEAAGKAEPEQDCRSICCQLQGPEGLCITATWESTALSLSQEKVPKNSPASALNYYRPVALTSHIMKVLERLLLAHVNKQVKTFQDPLQFAYCPWVGVEDAIIYLLYCHLDKAGSTFRIRLFRFLKCF